MLFKALYGFGAVCPERYYLKEMCMFISICIFASRQIAYRLIDKYYSKVTSGSNMHNSDVDWSEESILKNNFWCSNSYPHEDQNLCRYAHMFGFLAVANLAERLLPARL